MTGKAIGISMNYGYPGNYARTPDDIVASRMLNDASAAVPFGAAVCIKDDNTYEAVGAATTAADVAGIALRVVKQAISYNEQNYTEYQPGAYMSVLERGAATVVCNVGTPKANGKVYVRVKANTSIANGVVGGFEAAADGANTIEIPNMRWTNGSMDANRICEVTLLTRAAA